MLAFLNALSPMHILLILVVALLLFGNRLPEVARSIGRAFNEFKRGLRDVNDTITEETPPPPAEKPRLQAPDQKPAEGARPPEKAVAQDDRSAPR